MSTLRKSFFWSFAQRYFGVAISFITLPILSRLLTPEEIGIYSVGIAFVMLAHAVRNFGVADYLIQEKELTKARIRTAFSVALVIGWSIGSVLILLSTPISWLYGEPGLRDVLRVLGLNFFVIPFSLPVLALLRREMAFRTRARIAVASSLTHAFSSVSLVVAGFGYMGMAWASLIGVMTTAVLVLRYRPQGVGFRPSFSEWRRVASFGGMATGTVLLNVLGERAPDFVLGRVIGFSAVGMYSRGEGLVNLFREGALNAIQPVVLPALSAQHRAGGDIRSSYLRGVSYLTGIAWPFFGFVGLMAYPVIRIVFGPQWDAAVPVAQVLCFAAALGMPLEFANNVLIAVGQIRKEMYAQAITAPVQIIALVALSFYSLEMAALAAVVRFALLSAVRTRFLKQHTGIGFVEIVRATRKSLGLMVFTCAVPAGVVLTMDINPENLWLPFFVAASGAGLGWLGGLFLLEHPITDEIALHAGAFRQVLARVTGRAGPPS